MPKTAEQPEFDFDHALPAGKEWFTIRYLARHWGRSLQHIRNLVEKGAIRTSVDMRGEGATRADTNIPRWAVVEFLNKRKQS